jgi:hypothetical protein
MAATLALEDAADAAGTASPTGSLVDRLLVETSPNRREMALFCFT